MRQITLLLTSHSSPCFKHAHFILSCDCLIQARISAIGGSSRGAGQGACALLRETFWILTSKGPLSWVPESFRQDIGKISTWKVFFLLKINLFMKNLTYFCKTVETGWVRA